MYYAARMGAIAILFLYFFNAAADGAFRYNAFLRLTSRFYLRIFTALTTLCALWLLFDRDLWLPFLAPAAIPKNVIAENTSVNGDSIKKITLNVGVKNTKVIYWHAYNTGAKILDVKSAYGDYKNARVTTSDEHGNATFYITEEPSAYRVPYGQVIPPHIHYRYMESDTMASAVKTHYVDNL